ncbi:ribonuclease P protein component [Gammaproteobacteria bacterium]|nr:ribonuclease P protein component [Gammaproteobacteria bacterium]
MSVKRCFTLKDRSTIKQTLNKGKSHQKNCMVAKIHPSKNGGVLVFVKKKQVKHAVKRNRIKRIVLNAYRETSSEVFSHNNIIIFFKAAPTLSKVRQMTLALFDKIIGKPASQVN